MITEESCTINEVTKTVDKLYDELGNAMMKFFQDMETAGVCATCSVGAAAMVLGTAINSGTDGGLSESLPTLLQGLARGFNADIVSMTENGVDRMPN